MLCLIYAMDGQFNGISNTFGHPYVALSGELEDEWAGEPGKRLRERYLFAARYTASSGIATCLIINDFDVGVGRFANTGEK